MQLFRAFIICLLLLLGLLCSSCFKREGLGPGENAPAFTLPDLSGKSVSLHDFEGKVVVLNFWASWCAPCITEMPALQSLYDRAEEKGIVVLAVAEDERAEEIEALVEKLGLKFPVLLDETGSIKDRYKVQGYPETYILDPKGKVVLFPDPGSNIPATKIIGPREWDSPEYSELLQALVTQ